MDKIYSHAVWENIEDDELTMIEQKRENFIETSMSCYQCHSSIPKESVFCPKCGQKLYIKCPKCGKKYSSQWSYCSSCGVNKAEYIKKKEQVRKEKELNSPQIIDFNWEKLAYDLKFTWHTRNATKCYLRMRRLDRMVYTIIEQCPLNGSYNINWTIFDDCISLFEGEVNFAIELECESEKYPRVYKALYLRIKIPFMFGTWEVNHYKL